MHVVYAQSEKSMFDKFNRWWMHVLYASYSQCLDVDFPPVNEWPFGKHWFTKWKPGKDLIVKSDWKTSRMRNVDLKHSIFEILQDLQVPQNQISYQYVVPQLQYSNKKIICLKLHTLIHIFNFIIQYIVIHL